MKIKIAPTLVAILTFFLITGIYSSYKPSYDGWNKIGFPFYIYTHGKVGNLGGQVMTDAGFTFSYLIIDFVVLILFVILVNYLFSKYQAFKKA